MNFQISNLILLYQCILFVYYYVTKHAISKYVSWTLLPSIYIFLVLIFVGCESVPIKIKMLVGILKLVFLATLLRMPLIVNMKQFLLGSSVLFIYYALYNINKIYSCKIIQQELFVAYIVSSIVYFMLSKFIF